MKIEEKLICKIIYKNKKIKKADLLDVNLSIFTKIASSHLIIPLIYSKIKDKNIANLFPSDFIKYYKEIYKINKARNIKMIEEIKHLTTKLNDSKIEYMLIKGSALIMGKYYNDLGERMVGDIDFIIDKKNSEKLKKLLAEMNYNEKKKQFFKFRHLPRRVHKKKLFAIEPHIKLVNGSHELNDIIDFKEKVKVNGAYITKNEIMFLNNIYSFQINDKGYRFLNYSFKNLYDTIQITNKDKNFRKDLFNRDRYTRRYFKIIDNLNIFNQKFISKTDVHTSFLIYYKENFKSLFIIYVKILNFKSKLLDIPIQLKTFLLNKDYRKYLKNKFKIYL